MTEEHDDCDVTYKILLLGDSGVGKTSLIRALTGSKFSHNMLTTVGIDFVKVIFNVDGAKVRLQIWDTAGQERFRSIARFQYRSTKGLLLVYDITNRQSYETLSYWLDSIEKDIDQNNKEPIPIIIIGNKCDLDGSRKVSTDEGQIVAEKNDLSGFMETSAESGNNVRECFDQLAHAVTEVFNPELMNLYQFSTVRPKSMDATLHLPTTAGTTSPEANKQTKNRTIKLLNNSSSRERKRSRKCECNS